MQEILAVKDLSVTLENRKILSGLSFSLEEGESLAVIGPNGSGKTVLLKTLLGMFPHAGTITWKQNMGIGYVPQKIDADRHLPLTFANLFASKARLMKLPPGEIQTIVKTVGLTADIIATPVGHLSGGQFQRCLIAFALLGRPAMVLFDEPTASIDQPGEEQIYNLIHRLQDEYRITAVLVSHDLSFVYRYATKVLCLNQQTFCFGTPREVLNTGTLEKLFGQEFKYYHHIH